MTSAAALRILTYHRVIDAARGPTGSSVVSASPETFTRQMRHLARRYRVISAEELLAAVRGEKSLPERAVLISFDDAYRDVGEIAWPILRRYGLPAIVFVPTAFPDRPEREFWWDRLHRAFTSTRRRTLKWRPLPALALDTPANRQSALRRASAHLKAIAHDEAMAEVEWLCDALGGDAAREGRVLGWDALRELARDGMYLGAHTRTHPALTRVPADQMIAEIRGSREDLQREIGYAPSVFAYPFGDHDDHVVEAVRESGFEAALTCVHGQNRLESQDPLRLRRTNISRRTSPVLFGLRLLTPVSYLDTWRHRSAVPARGDAAT